MSYLDKILLFLYKCVGSGGVKFHSSSVNICIHRGISLEQRELYFVDRGKVAIEAGNDASGHMLQQFGRDVHLVAHGSKDIGIAYGIGYVIALHGGAEVSTQTEVDHKVVAHQLLLWGYTMEGVEVEVLQKDVLCHRDLFV